MQLISKRHNDRLQLTFRNLHLQKDVPLLGRYRLGYASSVLHSHCHKGTIEICYLFRGFQQYRVDGKDYHLRGNDIFIAFPNEWHGSGNSPEEKGILYWLQIKMPSRRRKTFLGVAMEDIQPILTEINDLPFRHFKGSVKLRSLFDAVIQAATAEEFYSRLTATTKLIELLLTVVQAGRRQARRDDMVEMAEVLKFIDDHPDRTLCVEELAERAGLSVSWFNAKFRRCLGVPPAEYVLRRKIEKAKAHLGRKETTVTKVAMNLGFSSSQYFATVFRRYTGHSPHHYRTVVDSIHGTKTSIQEK